MPSFFRRGLARLAVVSLASGLVATGATVLAGPAAADGGDQSAGGATARHCGMTDFGRVTIEEKGGSRWPVGSVGLFEMRTGQGGTLSTYCIDLRTGARRDFHHEEVGWDRSSLHNNTDAGKILWVLGHSCPKVAVAEPAEKAGAKELDQNDAAAATQAAIRHYSDKVTATPAHADAKLPTAYLLSRAEGLLEPKASLALAPPSVAGRSDGRLGPVTVSTNASAAALSLAPGAPDGARIPDRDGTLV
jgi:TQXA domain-containing protein